MSKIVFYTENLTEKVNTFISNLRDEDSNNVNRFITYDMMSAQTKIGLDSSATGAIRIASSIITLATLIEINIFIPVKNTEFVQDELSRVISEDKVDVACEVWKCPDETLSERESKITDNFTVVDIADQSDINVNRFYPPVKTVLYIMPTATSESKMREMNQNTEISVDINSLKDKCEFDTDVNVGVAVPQLVVASWSDIFKVFENVIDKEPASKVYVEASSESEAKADFFVRSVLDMCDDKTIPVVYGESLISITEKETTDNSEEEKNTSEEDIPDVSNDVEVIEP